MSIVDALEEDGFGDVCVASSCSLLLSKVWKMEVISGMFSKMIVVLTWDSFLIIFAIINLIFWRQSPIPDPWIDTLKAHSQTSLSYQFCVHSVLQCHWKKSCFEFGQAFTHVCSSSMFWLSTSVLFQSCGKKKKLLPPISFSVSQMSAESLFTRMHSELLVALVWNHPVLHVCHRQQSQTLYYGNHC